MKSLLFVLSPLMVLVAGLYLNADAKLPDIHLEKMVLEASTPADEPLLLMLNLETNPRPDFVRWKLTLVPESTDAGLFYLHLNYGVSQPNTLGFIGGGRHKDVSGDYAFYEKESDGILQKFLFITNEDSMVHLLLKQVHPYIWQVLNDDGSFMSGNGGWSYSLNQTSPSPAPIKPVPHTPSTDLFPSAVALDSIILVGRTPSAAIAQDQGWKLNEQSFKLKWKFVLYADHTGLFRTVMNNQAQNTKGTWLQEKLPDGQSVLIISPQGQKTPFRLAMLDHWVYLFMNKQNQVLVGNMDFSYTLDRLEKEN